MEIIGSVCLGLGLAAACGLRVFLPVLVLALAARMGAVHLGPSWAWLGSWPAVAGLSVAAAVEVAAFYVPFVDHLLDALAAPAAAFAGTLVAAAQLTGADAGLSPAVAWILAAIAGGGLATTVHLGTAGVRAASSVTTLGVGNAGVATAENAAAAGLSFLTLVMPLVAATLVGLGLVLVVLRLRRCRRTLSDHALTNPTHRADLSGHGLNR